MNDSTEKHHRGMTERDVSFLSQANIVKVAFLFSFCAFLSF